MLMHITTKKANSNSINRYTVLDGDYSDAIALYRTDLEEILSDKFSSLRTHFVVIEGLQDSVVVQATEQLLESLNKPRKDNPNIEQVSYRGLQCQYNSNTQKYYYGFMCGEITRLVTDEDEPVKKPRQYRNELTRAKALIRRYCLNWITICIDDETIIEKIL